MKNNLKKYLATIFVVSLTFSISSMDYPKMLEPKDFRKMGIEIETNAIKVKDIQKTNIGFLFQSGNKQWKLEDDTRDSISKEDESLYNLEINTLNGYYFDEFMNTKGSSHGLTSGSSANTDLISNYGGVPGHFFGQVILTKYLPQGLKIGDLK